MLVIMKSVVSCLCRRALHERALDLYHGFPAAAKVGGFLPERSLSMCEGVVKLSGLLGMGAVANGGESKR